ncbi:MAG: Unknown protein [uncultured Sulfurovum sp.]|uniref:Peptidase S8/S53 domain-containing protein n=1 Tax=uncultured Sulfurovum sp. TaxID=269237 RepID=A0A6S6TLL6_9BACT|nr:MAG: Unknown protein [uncultured Sulfurovum sp.]
MKSNYTRSIVLVSLLCVSSWATPNATTEQVLINYADKVKSGASSLINTNKAQVIVQIKAGIDATTAFQSFVKTNSTKASSIEMLKSFAVVGTKLGIKTSEKNHIVVLKSDTLSEEELVAEAKKIEGVVSVEVDQIVRINSLPNDAEFSKLWGLHNEGTYYGVADTDIDAPEAWKMHRGSKNVVVGITDGGIDYRHEDLVNNVWVNPNEIAGNGIDDDNNGYVDDVYGIDTINHDSDPFDDKQDHGTHVSGIIGAEGNNSVGVVGVNWNTSMASCKFIDNQGYGYLSGAAECVNYFTDLKVNRGINIVVTNNSWGDETEFSPIGYHLISLAGQAGILFVTSAGNNKKDIDVTPRYPEAFDLDTIITVAETNVYDDLSDYSNYGVQNVDLAAPGRVILSTTASNPNQCIPNDNQVFFTENFENNLSNWKLYSSALTDDENGDLPSEHLKIDDSEAYSGNASLADTLNETYSNYLYQTVQSKEGLLDFSSVSKEEVVCVSFKVKGETEEVHDHFGIFATFNNDINHSIGVKGSSLVEISGNYDEWTEVSAQLPPSFFEQNLSLIFTRINNIKNAFAGYNIDDIKISTGTLSPIPSHAYDIRGGTSGASAYVTGAIALLASAHPDKTALELKEIILNSVDKLDSLNGLVATGGRLNLHKMLKLANGTLKVANDFNGDGYSDLLIHNIDNDRLSGWFGSEEAEVNSKYLKELGLARQVVATGDINGDGYEDVIVENSEHYSENYVLSMLKGGENGGTEGVYLRLITPFQKVIGTADLNGDGYDDILIQNMENFRVNALLGSQSGMVTPKYLKTLSQEQEFTDIADVNGDGYDDVLVTNSMNGRVNAWLSDMNATVQNKYLKTLSPNVQIVEAIDYNHDGYDDIIVQNNDNKRVNAWLSNANANMTNHYINTLGEDVGLKGLSDINGDGFPDIIVVDYGGTHRKVDAWINNEGESIRRKYLKRLGKHVKLKIEKYDINGDGYEDIILQHGYERISAWLGSANGTVTHKYLKSLSDGQSLLFRP